jgi:hypothetical protein
MSHFKFKLLHVIGGMLLCMAPVPSVRADSWALPSVTKIRSENGAFELVITPASEKGSASAILRKTQGESSTSLWEAKLVNKVAPVSAKVTDSGRYVATFDEWHSVGTKPVVIYGDGGRLVAELSRADLKLEDHPNITMSVSSYWWDEHAIMLFGPRAEKGGEPWQQSIEDSLFIRLYWGEVIAIDLASGKVRNDPWWSTYPKDQQDKLKKATNAYLDATWHRLADDYLRKANFEPDPSYNGVTGILLAGQLRLREALPLLHELAGIERFGGWAAPRWKGANNLKELVKIAVAEIEGNGQKP